MGCGPTKRLETAVKKLGVKESIGYMAKTYPEYFNPTIQHDTVLTVVEVPIVKDSIITNTLNCDSLMKQLTDGTTVILAENNKLKLELFKVKGGFKVKSNVKPDTVKVPVNVPVEIRVPCPDTSILANENKDLKTKLEAHKYKTVTTVAILISIILLLIGLLLYKSK